MAYLFAILVVAALVYAGWRLSQARTQRPMKRVIGPDDDPEFLWRLNHGDNNPR